MVGGPDYQSPSHEILLKGVKALTRSFWSLPEAIMPRFVETSLPFEEAVAGGALSDAVEDGGRVEASAMELLILLTGTVDGPPAKSVEIECEDERDGTGKDPADTEIASGCTMDADGTRTIEEIGTTDAT